MTGIFIPLNLDMADQSGLTALILGAIGAGAVITWALIITIVVKLITWTLKDEISSGNGMLKSDENFLKADYWTYGYIIPSDQEKFLFQR